jgi:hypothetical protein
LPRQLDLKTTDNPVRVRGHHGQTNTLGCGSQVGHWRYEDLTAELGAFHHLQGFHQDDIAGGLQRGNKLLVLIRGAGFGENNIKNHQAGPSLEQTSDQSGMPTPGPWPGPLKDIERGFIDPHQQDFRRWGLGGTPLVTEIQGPIFQKLAQGQKAQGGHQPEDQKSQDEATQPGFAEFIRKREQV